jgi:hypothetical protein
MALINSRNWHELARSCSCRSAGRRADKIPIPDQPGGKIEAPNPSVAKCFRCSALVREPIPHPEGWDAHDAGRAGPQGWGTVDREISMVRFTTTLAARPAIKRADRALLFLPPAPFDKMPCRQHALEYLPMLTGEAREDRTHGAPHGPRPRSSTYPAVGATRSETRHPVISITLTAGRPWHPVE